MDVFDVNNNKTGAELEDAPESAKNGSTAEVSIFFVDILEYVGIAVRPIKEGHAVFSANHIICIGFRKKDSSGVEIVAYVQQSSNPGADPHELNLKIWSNINEWILKCSCKVGTAKCKHIIACLLYMEKFNKLEYLSCTDVRQAWGMCKTKKPAPWGAKRISELCCFKHPKNYKFDIVKSDHFNKALSESYNRILSVSKGSAIFKHKQGRFMNQTNIYPNRALQAVSSSSTDRSTIFCSRTDLRECLSTNFEETELQPTTIFNSAEEKLFFEKHIALGLDKCIEIALDTKNQNSNEWKMHRSNRITASNCYKLYTYLRNKNPNWESKIEEYWSIKSLNVKAVQYGKYAEPLAFNCYLKKRNPLCRRCGLVISSQENWFGGSPDRIDPISKALLEIKCPVSKDASLETILCSPSVAKFAKHFPPTGKFVLNKNHAYYCQVQLNMWILNLQSCDFIIYSCKEDDFELIEVPFDKEFAVKILNDLKQLFFQRMLGILLKRIVK
ncbi:uncharacterized protein LOC128745832 [Sabethes cyaneus]|uniref:uncharacterized protein LOC128745832 n=1 Tax=Sabethes cyaneus TaxID=53552 RepID=UPI00237DEA7D|nr:uncharacterized protein LOC128745832 [Sabethes cyaneus]